MLFVMLRVGNPNTQPQILLVLSQVLQTDCALLALPLVKILSLKTHSYAEPDKCHTDGLDESRFSLK